VFSAIYDHIYNYYMCDETAENSEIEGTTIFPSTMSSNSSVTSTPSTSTEVIAGTNVSDGGSGITTSKSNDVSTEVMYNSGSSTAGAQSGCSNVRVHDTGKAHIWLNFTVMFLLPVLVSCKQGYGLDRKGHGIAVNVSFSCYE